MILGVGVDIIKVSRFVHWTVNKKLSMRFFDEEELEYIYSRGQYASLSFASHFAAKEAYGKALGSGLAGFALREVSVICKAGAGPLLHLCGNAKLLFEKAGGKHIHLSLSHEAEYATSFVVIEG